MTRSRSGLVLANLLIVYLVWGSTYLAIRVLVDTVPPLTGVALRFAVAGVVLCAWCAAKARCIPRMTRDELIGALIGGTFILAAAYGLLATAQQELPSGLAANVIASVPLWVCLLAVLHGQRLRRSTTVAVVLGIAAVVVLSPVTGGVSARWAMAALVGAALAEGIGTFYAARRAQPHDALFSAGVQMVIAAVLLGLGAVILGERLDLGAVSAESALALAYLIVPGSIVAYASFVWLISNVPLPLATTYAFVNPAVALLLGWAILAEPLTARLLLGSALVIASVLLLWRAEKRGQEKAPPHDSHHAVRRSS